MTSEIPVTLEYIDRQIAKLTEHPRPEHKWDITIGDLLLVRQGLVAEAGAQEVQPTEVVLIEEVSAPTES